MSNNTSIISLEDQIKGMHGSELKEYINYKYKHYKSSPEGCVDYIQECLYVGIPGRGYVPFELWDTQRKMIIDIVSCMFDNSKDIYIGIINKVVDDYNNTDSNNLRNFYNYDIHYKTHQVRVF